MEKFFKNIAFYYKIKFFFFPFYRAQEIKKLFNILEKGKQKNTQVAMFVGGCVRKFLSNEVIDDIDIATTFTPEEIKIKLKDFNFSDL